MLAPCDVGRRIIHPAPGWHEECTWPAAHTFRVHLQGHTAVVSFCEHHLAGTPALAGDPTLLPPVGASWEALEGASPPSGPPVPPQAAQGGPEGGEDP